MRTKGRYSLSDGPRPFHSHLGSEESPPLVSRAFNDSLATKGYEPHKLIITSVLRTDEDITRLRRFNRNASENSCHRHGTTFDISYNRFLEPVTPDGDSRIRWVTPFKSILAEVLRDQRLAGTCYVKYEVHQSCFHITAR